ncbi:methylmalonyl-CoA mutase family protein [Fodinibacter luteus]|uniref:Methylmalonyl-CoA mutase family protein n=1 Tax=Fodinibacter luteus TaxID=552064 RepID=A0ABP8KI71_9MICO
MTDASLAPETTPPDTFALAAGFPEQGREDWQRLVAAVLNKGRAADAHLDGPAAEQALRRRLEGGIEVDALYLAGDRPLGLPGAMPFTRGRAVRDPALPWDVRQLHDDPDAAVTRAAVLDDLEHGVTSVWVHLGDDGLAVADLPEALAEVRLDLAPVVVSSFTHQAEAARALLAHVGDRPSAGGNLGLDPVGAAARLGRTPDLGALADLVRACAGRDGWRAVTVDARVLHDAGASDVDALAVAVATGVEYLRHLEAAGIAPTEAFGQVEFRVGATADQFLTAAGLRALRRVWARVGEACGVPEEQRGARTHLVTSLRMFTRDDPWVNVLRSTLAAFGASVGGADAVSVLPYDTVLGLPERFGRRLARNTQILLADESNVGRVTDPGGGSWYLESLTDDVADAVWSRFQEVERAGGAVRALTDGLLATWVAGAVAARDDELATRRRPLTGVSMFPLTEEAVATRRARVEPPATDGALTPRRDATAYERLRDRARALANPAVVVRTLGTRREFGARQAFVTNLLAAGGVTTVDEGAPVAVIASNRAGYAEHGAAAVAELRAAGAQRVLVAGRAGELGEDAGLVDGEVRDGMDVVAFLDDLLDRLGAPPGGPASPATAPTAPTTTEGPR